MRQFLPIQTKLRIFAKLSNPGIYVILKSRSQLLPGKVAQISGFYCGWKMFWQKFCVVANWSPTVSSQGGVKHNHVLGEDCPQSPVLNFKLFSCEDAAQQVLMYVCLSVRLSVWVPSWNSFTVCNQYSSRMFPNVPECSRMHAECSRIYQNVPE